MRRAVRDRRRQPFSRLFPIKAKVEMREDGTDCRKTYSLAIKSRKLKPVANRVAHTCRSGSVGTWDVTTSVESLVDDRLELVLDVQRKVDGSNPVYAS